MKNKEVEANIAANVAQQRQEEQELTAYPRVQGLIDIMSTGSDNAKELMLEDFKRAPDEQRSEMVGVLTRNDRGPHVIEILRSLNEADALKELDLDEETKEDVNRVLAA